MTRTGNFLSALIVSIFCSLSVSGQSFDWREAKPEDAGFSSEKINALRDSMAAHKTSGLLVIRKDRIVLEWYAPGYDRNRKHSTASLAKALVGGMSLLLALDDGRLSAEDPVSKYIPSWKNDPLKSMITIRHLATHSSGIEDAEVNGKEAAEYKEKGITIKDRHMDIPGWKGNFWRQKPDPFTISRDSAPVIFTPGTSYHYSNTGMALLAYAVTSSYSGTDVKDIRTLLKERIMRPIGVSDDDWSIGYGKAFTVDGLNLVANWGGGNYTPRAIARVGRLMLRRGNWEGMQLVDSALIDFVTAYAGTPEPPRHSKEPNLASGLAWYTNYDGIWPKAPRDLFAGSGAGNQTLIIIPSLDMIIVRNGQDMYDPVKGEGHFYGVMTILVNQLMDALTEPPYPKSELITEVRFAPADNIIRKAEGCDNWPATWADDNNLYSAYGDGWGFEPKVEKKLSMGLSKISGDPPDIKGINIRSETGEQAGQGRNGIKASGMLMIDGILYMWVRNANRQGEESQLAWSEDHGKTWKYCDWRFTEGFGCPTFLNFGKNYSGARDNYVYIYSFDEKDAYKSSDRMVMARVDKRRITSRSEYEFFRKITVDGKPSWTRNITERGAVFSNPAMCYRSGISYNPGIKRYIWCQVLPVSDHSQGPRFEGGFGIYEAPEPWGPWRTVYYTRKWDVGPGETSSFPVKWISTDGKTCHLLFSGDDYFSVRRVEFVTR